jgi:hypothetical protein
VKVHILGHDLDVVFTTEEEDEELKDSWGRLVLGDQKIYLDKNVSPVIARETLFHEILHAVDIMGCPRHLAESTIHRMSAIMYGTLRDNPEVVKWLFEEVEDDAPRTD